MATKSGLPDCLQIDLDAAFPDRDAGKALALELRRNAPVADNDIAIILGITLTDLRRWFKRDKEFRLRYERARSLQRAAINIPLVEKAPTEIAVSVFKELAVDRAAEADSNLPALRVEVIHKPAQASMDLGDC